MAKLTNKGLRALTTSKERQEIRAVLENRGGKMTPAQVVEAAKRNGVTLEYLERSEEMGLALFNVMAPQIEGYKYGPNSGVPTFALETLKQKGLIPWF